MSKEINFTCPRCASNHIDPTNENLYTCTACNHTGRIQDKNDYLFIYRQWLNQKLRQDIILNALAR